MHLLRYCLFILLLIPGAVVCSQQQKQYAFSHLSTSAGLVSNFVLNIEQDKNGYIWIGTIDGLQRYDGNHFITFRNNSKDPYSIPGDYINALYTDKKNNLWLISNNTAGIFHTSNFRFEAIAIQGEDTLHRSSVISVGEAENGYAAIYLAEKGLYIYDPVKNMFVPKGLFRFKETKYYYDITSMNGGKEYWIAMTSGLAIYNTKTGNVNYRGHNPDSSLIIKKIGNDSAIASLYFTYKDSIWYTSWPLEPNVPYINVLSLKTGEKRSYGMGGILRQYTETGGGLVQHNGRKWFYGRSFLCEYTGNEQSPFLFINNEFKNEQSINFDRVNYLFEDRQYNLWVGTDNGVFIFNPDAQFFNNYKLTHDINIPATDGPTIAACELNDGNIMIGCWGRGLYYYDNNFTPLPLPRPLNMLYGGYSIWTIHQHSKTGLVWMGLQDGGIVVYDGKADKAEMFNTALTGKSTIRQIIEDDKGNLWFGLQNGSIVKWNFSSDIHAGYERIKEADHGYINKLLFDKGSIWVASIAYGVFKYDAYTHRLLAHYAKSEHGENGLWSNYTADVFRYNDTTILIANGALDILNTRTGLIEHITTEKGLPSNTANSILADDEGILWLGMINHLCRLNLQKKIFSSFDKRDGIGYDIFNSACDYKLKDGRFVFLTDKSILTFNPLTITTAPAPPTPVITGFTAGNTPLMVDSISKLATINLKYNSNAVTIEFNALNYTLQNKLHYYYMLEGLDKDWRMAGTVNEAIYNYLPSGDYTFKVKAINTEGKESPVTELQLHVVPPFWQTWWFLGMVILLALLAFYWIDRERIKKLQALQKVRTQIAQNLHKDINTTLNQISLLSEMAKLKADKDVERSKEYIAQINNKSRSMIDSMDDILWTLNPQNDTMEKTILRMKQYAESIQSTYPAEMLLEVDESVKNLKLDMKTHHEIFLIFKIMLRAIAETTNSGETITNIDLAGKKLLLKIQNNKVHLSGTEAEKAFQEIYQRAEFINAEPDIQNDSTGVSLILMITV